jgi:pimeloyl-ACP methyl ester carboxylesterase
MTRVQWTGGTEHWTHKGDIRLFLWNKPAHAQVPKAGTILFVHGSSMASQPTFDLSVPGRPHSSVMDWFAERGFDTWCMDNEGYGRSDKSRPINFDIANGAEDLAAGSDYILQTTGAQKLLVYGISSGALKAALFAQHHPERIAKLALDAFVWTALLIAHLCTAFSTATMGPVPTRPPKTPLPMPSSPWTRPCPLARMSTCALSCP